MIQSLMNIHTASAVVSADRPRDATMSGYQPLSTESAEEQPQEAVDLEVQTLSTRPIVVRRFCASVLSRLPVLLCLLTLLSSWCCYWLFWDTNAADGSQHYSSSSPSSSSSFFFGVKLPALSETGLGFPGRFIFTAGLIFASGFFLIVTWLLHVRLRMQDLTWANGWNWARRVSRFLASLFGAVSVLFLVLLAVVRLDDDFVLHQVYAGLFFLSALLQGVCVLAVMRSYHLDPARGASHVVAAKQRTLLVGFGVWFVLPVLLILLLQTYCSWQDLSQKACAEAVHPDSAKSVHAILQYLLISCLLLHARTYGQDLAALEVVLLVQ